MRAALAPLLVATSLSLTLVACGIKGPPRPPAPAPATETQPPPSATERGPVEPSGPTLTPTPESGVETPLTPSESPASEDAGAP
ncbi:lipoprotein [Myxococcus sp. Y35]|uniref:lipoprotein n=1 Tax=Pseudomyxococcus flavus TaxID=3115648 RepID=UPI003CF631E5